MKRQPETLFHLVPVHHWQAIKPGDTYYPATYEQDGFLHATADASLLMNIANHFYAGSDGDWLCLETTVTRVEAAGVEVRFEAAAAVGDTAPEIPGVTADQLFPHVFGGLSPECIVAVHRVERDANGTFVGIESVS